MLNKWKCPYSLLLHLNLNAVMWKINSINLAEWGASKKPSWLVMQIKELRGFHCPTHFPQNFAFLLILKFSCFTVGYSPAVEQAEPWHRIWSSLGPGFQLQRSSKISRGGIGKLQVSLSHYQRCWGHKSNFKMVSHLKMPIFLCYIAQDFVCLFGINFVPTRSISFFTDFIMVPREPQVPWGPELWAMWESSLLLPQAFPRGRRRRSRARMWRKRRQKDSEIHLLCSAAGVIQLCSCSGATSLWQALQCTGWNMSSSLGCTWLWRRPSSLCFPSHTHGRSPGYA